MLPEVTHDLSRSWRLMLGHELSFDTNRTIEELDDAGFFTLSMENNTWGEHAAVLLVSRTDLIQAAAVMFDIDQAAVEADHIDDVGRELCNVLGACCTKLFGNEMHGFGIGLPQTLSHSELTELFARGTLLCEFVATNLAGSPTIRVIKIH